MLLTLRLEKIPSSKFDFNFQFLNVKKKHPTDILFSVQCISNGVNQGWILEAHVSQNYLLLISTLIDYQQNQNHSK